MSSAAHGDPNHDNRAAILAATAHALALHGVRGLRVEEVATEAEVSPGLLYYHFGNRAGLIEAALELAAEQAPSMKLAYEEAGSGFEGVERALLAELDADESVRQYAVVWGEVSATAVFEPALQAVVARVWNRWRGLVADGLRRGVDDGSVRADVDPEITADLLISLVDGLCTRWLTGSIEREKAVRLLREGLAEISAISSDFRQVGQIGPKNLD